MSDIRLDIDTMKSVLQSVAADLKSHSEELRQLDARVGDGDLGVTIELASQAMAEYLASSDETDIGKLLAQCGMNINKVSPSTFGTILASAFMGGGKAVVDKRTIGVNELVLIGEGAIENIKKRGKAEAGDKTLLDALIPAVETLKNTAGSNDQQSLDSAVKSAEEGMKATMNMKAKFGRAQWFKERSIGVQDGGATAIYYMIKSFAEHIPE
ncbi:MAG: dihydroxyacetone kinase subunit L [Dehalococcoidales bacterium]|nr:MAG: dihydroxyacetone kinase subunit L [Dehalococcoidales bacterium]